MGRGMLRYAVLSLNSAGICFPHMMDVTSPSIMGRKNSRLAMWVLEYASLNPNAPRKPRKSGTPSAIIGMRRAKKRRMYVHFIFAKSFICAMNTAAVWLAEDFTLYLAFLRASSSVAL